MVEGKRLHSSNTIMRLIMILVMMLIVININVAAESEVPTPRAWPEQFHATVISNTSGALQLVDLWYDWPNGRNLNVEQDQLAEEPLYNVQWNNNTSFFIQKIKQDCQIYHFGVGILRPNWMEGGNYLGQTYMDGFLCNVWEKADEFIWYYEDVITKQPVYWLLFTVPEKELCKIEVLQLLEDIRVGQFLIEYVGEAFTPTNKAAVPARCYWKKHICCWKGP